MLKIIGKKKVFSGKHLNVWSTEFLDKIGNKKVWEWYETLDSVHIFPITSDQKAVLIKSFRVPLERYIIEMPAGLLDKDGESPIDAARRELFEETGYFAEKLVPVPKTWPHQPGASRSMAYGFIATGLKKIRDTVGDNTEDIEVVEVPLEGLMEYYLNLPDDTFFGIRILAVAKIAEYLKIKG